MCPAYFSKYNSEHEKQVIFQWFQSKKKLALSCSKKLSGLLKGITSKHHGDFYCMSCHHSFATENYCHLDA